MTPPIQSPPRGLVYPAAPGGPPPGAPPPPQHNMVAMSLPQAPQPQQFITATPIVNFAPAQGYQMPPQMPVPFPPPVSAILTLKVLVATIDAQWEGMGM